MSDYAAAEKAVAAVNRQIEEAERLDELAVAFLRAQVMQVRGRIRLVHWREGEHRENDRRLAYEDLTAAREGMQAVWEQSDEELKVLREKYRSNAPKQSRWRQLQNYLSRIHYTKAWIDYSLGLLIPKEQAPEKHFRRAMNTFETFTSDGYQPHPVVADCFLGVGLCLYELGEHQRILELLNVNRVTPDNTPVRIFRRMTRLRIKAAQAIPSHLHVINAAQQYLESLPAESGMSAGDLQLSLAWAKSIKVFLSSSVPQAYRESLFHQRRRLIMMVYSYGDAWREALLQELEPIETPDVLTELLQSRVHFSRQEYVPALKAAVNCLERGEGSLPAAYLPDLYFLHAASNWNLQHWQAAYISARAFVVKFPDDDRRGRMGSIVLQGGYRALQANQVSADEFQNALREMKEFAWPDDMKDAMTWYEAKTLLDRKLYENALQVLETIEKSSLQFSLALYGCALAHFERAVLLIKRHGDEAVYRDRILLHLNDTITNLETFIALGAETDSESLRQGMLTIGLAAAQTALTLDPPAYEPAQKAVHVLETDLSSEQEFAGQRQALKLAAFAREDIEATCEAIMEIIEERADEEPFLRALITIANIYEQAVREDAGALGTSTMEKVNQCLLAVYEYLSGIERVNRFSEGLDEYALRKRTADVMMRLGQYDFAAAHYEWLMKQSRRGDTATIERELALAYTMTQDYKASLTYWRRLTRIRPGGSAGWFEGYYYMIKAYRHLDQHDKAVQLLNYVRLRYPDIENETWREAFMRLSEEIMIAQPAETGDSKEDRP